MTRAKNDFWAITSYFNLTGGRNRLRNYHCFRQNLSLPLLTVEWHPERQFHLTTGDADMLLQLGGGDFMWQKERLLKAAAAALPAHVRYVAWIDGDILFTRPDWTEEARSLLESKSVIQLYSELAYCDEEESRRIADAPHRLLTARDDRRVTHESFLSLFGKVKDNIVQLDLDRRFLAQTFNSPGALQRPVPGFGCAAQAAFLREAGFYDRCIMGAGDLLFCYGVTGLSQELLDNQQTLGWTFYGDCQSYRRWAQRAAAFCEDRLGCLDGRILHLFHGNLADRQYRARIEGLLPFGLDLDRDIVAVDGEPWCWRRDRDVLNAYFLNYLKGRKEDDSITRRETAG